MNIKRRFFRLALVLSTAWTGGYFVTTGAEGLQHLMGLIIGFEENGELGGFEWSVNTHLERLGYKRKKSRFFIRLFIV